ncbi:hypothetical protein Esi_0258_0045 [Ectocarpus siliculosus]|uniref:Uncharacterized protein n=1 Tax=Ectocarpus siliculosus TaxID=2880 RepID=D8LJH5_ECTSI|nr:hypothetical protein Esi_0258_0045 [Ectocarpus siliculosus]|eukprot:CBN75976.1 hypothetical protein Esi_0258_0045 [Ectocarpus siliculosus]
MAMEGKKGDIIALQTKLRDSLKQELARVRVNAEAKENMSPVYAFYAMALYPASPFSVGFTAHLRRTRNNSHGWLDVRALYNCVLEAFTEDDAAYFSANDNKRLAAVVRMAEKWIPVLMSFVGGSYKDDGMGRDVFQTGITKKVFKKGFGRIERKFPALTNTSTLISGCNTRSGELIPAFVSTSTTVVPVNKQVLLEYIDPCTEKGYDARVMYLTFAVLVVDRALSRGQKCDDVPQRFHDLWAAMPNCTKPLKDALLSSADDLVLRDSNGEIGEYFFDDSRLRFFDAQKADSGVGVSGVGKDQGVSGNPQSSKSSRVVATCARGIFYGSVPTSFLKDLGVVTDAGNKAVYVTLAVDDEDYLEDS